MATVAVLNQVNSEQLFLSTLNRRKVPVMSKQLSTLFTLFFGILVMCLLHMAQGQVRLIGASRPIRAEAGDDVMLPCRCEPPVDLTPMTVEWKRVQLKPDPSDAVERGQIVHVYPDHRDKMKRTEMFPDQLRAGNASLKLQHVTLYDIGIYICHISNLTTNDSLRTAQAILIVRTSEVDKTKRAPVLDGIPENSSDTSIFIVSFLGIVVCSTFIIIIWRGVKRNCTARPVTRGAAGVSVYFTNRGTLSILESDSPPGDDTLRSAPEASDGTSG